MANKSGKSKVKKPLPTTLGKAANQNETEVDLSHVQKPLNTSVFGLKQALTLFQTATKEVQSYITYECDIMYECRICKTIFRSLANFILHKRDYCKERFHHLDLHNNSKEVEENECTENSQSIQTVESSSLSPDKDGSSVEARKSLLPVIERLKEKQEICKLAQEVLNQDFSSKDSENSNESNEIIRNNDLLLEEIATNNAAVFQTVLRNTSTKDMKMTELMKSEVMEIHGILDRDEAILGPDGKICTFKTNKVDQNPNIPKNDLFCTECNLKFSTKKTLTYHIKYKHNNTRMVYVCPDCKDTFANAWCVYRHLFKVHRRTSAQIKRMREQIHNSCIRKDQEPVKKKDKKNCEKAEKADEENQWLSNIEGDKDFQMCGGCGKRFERKAALHSHAQMCIKRIAVCNTIKDNAKKKEEELSKDFKSKSAKVEKIVLKGSSKRKPYLLRTYKYNGRECHSDKELLSKEINSDICDVNANCEIVETNCDNNKDSVEEVALTSTEDIPKPQSPTKSIESISSPSIEKIDTEKMLHIIGVSGNYENMQRLNESTNSPVKNPGSETDQETNKSHTALDFDLFCQNVADSLLPDSSVTTQEVKDYTQKVNKIVPLILRRKSLSKYEKKSVTLEQNTDDNTQTEEKGTDKEDENIAQETDLVATDSLQSNSNFKISVKSLQELIGVSPQDHVINLETRDMNINTITNEMSKTFISNVCTEQLQGNHSKCMKRKRTTSFDSMPCNKFSKALIYNKQDVSFISKASPFMDENKLICMACHTTYPTYSKLLWHMSAHFSWFRFQCSRCSFISFNKHDCASHARKTHFVNKGSIQSVVLPIPNWKTVLMSHEFSMLGEERDDLSGKHTDEVLLGNAEDDGVPIEERDDDESKESDFSSVLFEESRIRVTDDKELLDSKIVENICFNIKQENIDVIEDKEDSFQIEVPQEIYTLDVSEIIEEIGYEERYHHETQVNVKSDEDTNIDDYIISEIQENGFDEVNVEEETVSNIEADNEVSNAKLTEANDFNECFKPPEPVVNVRPARNRTRSIKTLQEDFFYDLNKVIKLNDTSLSKSNSQKYKKLASLSQKGGKVSVSSNKKGETKQIRVYSKKK